MIAKEETLSDFLVATHSTGKRFMGRKRAVLPCGCCTYVGWVVDDEGEPATAATPCCDDHNPLMERFQRLLMESLNEPEDRPLIDVVVELLTEAAVGETVVL